MDAGGFMYYIDNILLPSIKNKSILLILDNFAGHPHSLPNLEKYKNIKLIYLPANTTSRLQPLDQGIIAALKLNYQKLIMTKRLDTLDNYNKILNNIHTKNGGVFLGHQPSISDSWYTLPNSVQSDTIKKAINSIPTTNFFDDVVSTVKDVPISKEKPLVVKIYINVVLMKYFLI